LRVSLHPERNRTALVTTRFVYADGSARIYPVPLVGPTVDVAGFWLAGWRADGLQRLRSEHLDFPEQPFANAQSPLQLGQARRLELAPAANRLDEINPAHWLWNSVRLQHLAWSPTGEAFLAAFETSNTHRQLWRVPLDGAPPTLLASGDLYAYGWSPDGQWVVYTRLDPSAAIADARRPYAVLTLPATPTAYRAESVSPRTLVTGLASPDLPGLTAAGVWFFTADGLWLAPYAAGAPTRLAALPAPADLARPSPNGARLAYRCNSSLCLANTDLSANVTIRLRPDEMAWSPDGQQLAVIDRDLNNLRAARLVVLSAAGEVQLTAPIAPRDASDAPQWTPDGRVIFVQTFPQDGRRIIAVEVASGQALDLSREHWDAYFALAPDGRSVLLNNGRGDFWLADVLRR
jgi:dipeptidyl aminopeptidase/acylaminoacyl peptidase